MYPKENTPYHLMDKVPYQDQYGEYQYHLVYNTKEIK